MITISGAELHRLLDFPSLIEALREMFRDGCTVPLRHHHAVPGEGDQSGTLLLMPAWQSGRHIGVKIVSVFPGNAARDLPAVHGMYVLIDGSTGVPQAMLDGTVLTWRRTAASSALAADYLARPDSALHLMVGTGALAPYLVAAHRTVRPIHEVLVWGRNHDKAVALAERLNADRIAATATADLAEASRRADIISCATLARDPLIRGEWLKPGAHLDLVGGYTPEMREADDTAITRARVYIDTDGATHEAGDIVQPLRAGILSPDSIAGDLFSLTRGTAPGRTDPDEITLFKSVGIALEDLAAAQLAFSRFAPP